MDKRQMELYTDYLLCNYGYATATGLLSMVHGEVSRQGHAFPIGARIHVERSVAGSEIGRMKDRGRGRGFNFRRHD